MFKTILSATIVSIASISAIIITRPDPTPISVECAQIIPPAHRVDIEDTIRQQAVVYGIDPDMAVSLAECESGLNVYAQNPKSTAKGLYQFTDGTWAYIKAQGHQFDAEENIHQFMIWWRIHPEWWVCE